MRKREGALSRETAHTHTLDTTHRQHRPDMSDKDGNALLPLTGGGRYRGASWKARRSASGRRERGARGGRQHLELRGPVRQKRLCKREGGEGQK
eukprot:1841291-Rhodomonas_salina.1